MVFPHFKDYIYHLNTIGGSVTYCNSDSQVRPQTARWGGLA